jgi:O-antigen/teichoic acid export membrane protein
MPTTLNTLMFTTVQLAVVIVTYGYYMLLARWSNAEDFARYAALTAAFTVYTVIGLSLTQSATRAATLGASPENLERAAWRFGARATPVVAVVCAALHLFVGLPWLWLAPLALSTAPYAVLSARRGQALAHGRNLELAMSFAFEHGGKLALTGLLSLAMPLVDAAALALGPSLLLALIAQPKPRPAATRTSTASNLERDAVSVGTATLGQLLSGNADVLLAQVLLPGASAGGYASAALVARVVLIGSSAVQSASFGALSHPASEPRAAKLLYGLISLGGATFVAGTVLFGSSLMRLVFGAPYESAGALLPWLGAGALGFALGHAKLQHLLANGRRWVAPLGFAGAFLQLSAFALWHGDALELARAQCVSSLVFAALIWMFSASNAAQRGGNHVLPSL